MGGMKDLLGDTLYELPRPKPAEAFDGETYAVRRDYVRLKGQMLAVFDLMADGHWRTLKQIAESVQGSEAAVSARLRDLRKEKYGAHTVEREHVENGLHRYRVRVNLAEENQAYATRVNVA